MTRLLTVKGILQWKVTGIQICEVSNCWMLRLCISNAVNTWPTSPEVKDLQQEWHHKTELRYSQAISTGSLARRCSLKKLKQPKSTPICTCYEAEGKHLVMHYQRGWDKNSPLRLWNQVKLQNSTIYHHESTEYSPLQHKSWHLCPWTYTKHSMIDSE